jgi:aryl-alcohol dehydrogenase-like predicted oxidoreductase
VGALQVEYSLFTRDIEAGVLPALRELGIACVAYGVLSRGLITGAITGPESFTPGDFRPHMPRFQPGNLQRNLELVANIKAFGADRGMTPAQVALAWLVSRGTDVVPLARISHHPPAATAQWHALAGFRSVVVLNVPSSTPARSSVATNPPGADLNSRQAGP